MHDVPCAGPAATEQACRRQILAAEQTATGPGAMQLVPPCPLKPTRPKSRQRWSSSGGGKEGRGGGGGGSPAAAAIDQLTMLHWCFVKACGQTVVKKRANVGEAGEHPPSAAAAAAAAHAAQTAVSRFLNQIGLKVREIEASTRPADNSARKILAAAGPLSSWGGPCRPQRDTARSVGRIRAAETMPAVLRFNQSLPP